MKFPKGIIYLQPWYSLTDYVTVYLYPREFTFINLIYKFSFSFHISFLRSLSFFLFSLDIVYDVESFKDIFRMVNARHWLPRLWTYSECKAIRLYFKERYTISYNFFFILLLRVMCVCGGGGVVWFVGVSIYRYN